MAQQIQTSMIDYQANGEKPTGYLTRPSGEGRWPGVVVIQEWWGLEPHIKDIADRFARAGFVALAPDLYHGQVAGEPDEAMKLARGMDKPRALKEVTSAVTHLKSQSFCSGKVGTIGYCMGGGLSLLTACNSRDVDAAVIYYGGNPDPIDQVQNVRCAILGLYGGADGGIPPSRVAQLGEALEQHGKTYDLHIYGGAPHGFFNDTRESYRKEFSEDAWQRTLAFFADNLTGS